MQSRRILLAALLCAVASSASSAELDASLLAGMKARSIGPAGMSGRIGAVCAVPSNPNIIYVGTATGGLWKSVDGGLAFEPIFDDQPVASIGAIAIDPTNPDVVWVGTGEGNLRNSVSVGNGVYLSRDGGRSFEHLGLEESERIHRIHIDPRNTDVVYFAVVGKLWGDSDQRGVFRTRDGGKTFEQVLSIDARTGCADLAMDPSNPQKLIAAMYEFRREPWFYTSGGKGSGLFLSVDGGDSWQEITHEDGLPKGNLGRIGVAIAPSDPDRVYAFVEAEENGFYRSEDGGFTWKKTGAEDNFGGRPFYYADIRVDPRDANRVYSLWSLVSVSHDGGEDFETLMPWSAAHPDHHAMWIHPDNAEFLINGNDGGVYISQDRGANWRFVSNLPVAQYYHVAVDDAVPYNVYGGMQDNGSWVGPSEVWENGGIRNHHWREVSFGDGFDTRPMPDDYRRGYSMSQEGNLYRWSLDDGEVRAIQPDAPDDSTKLRFNWNAGLAQDPFDPATIYYGSQFVHRSKDRGLSWEIISADLTTDREEWQKQDDSGGLTPDVTGAENFTTIVTIAPSPLQPGVLWVGTDDGRVHVTRDGGGTWTSLESRARGVPANTWVPHICPSPHDAGTAYIVFDNHRRSDLKTYVGRFTEFGSRYQSVSTDGVEGYALVIEQDFVDPDLLFLGTEFGLHVSIDGGRQWMKWTHGVPTVSVMDLALQRQEHDLVIGTHGRSAFVLDDIRPLRELNEEVLASTLHLFEIPPARQITIGQTGASRFPGRTEFRGENPPYGAVISFVVNAEELPHPDAEVEAEKAREERSQRRVTADEDAGEAGDEDRSGPDEGGSSWSRKGKKGKAVEVRILDENGDVVREFERDVHRGLNRIVWDFGSDPFRRPPGGRSNWWEQNATGPEVVPGNYTVVLEFGGAEAQGSLTVLGDPRSPITVEGQRANWEAQQRAGAVQEALVDAITLIVDARDDVTSVLDRIERLRDRAKDRGEKFEEGDEPFAELEKEAKDFRKQLGELESKFRRHGPRKGIPGGRNVWGELGSAQGFLSSSRDAPSPSALRHLERAESLASGAVSELNEFFAGPYGEFRSKVLSVEELRVFRDVAPVEVPRP